MSGLPPPPDFDPNRQGQYPPWNGQPDDHAGYPYPPATYPPPPDHDRPYYPPPQYPPPANMAAIHPHAQGQDPYRLPPPPGSYRPDVYAQPMPGPYSAAAPRQRTAIACRYCRRRKIRCSGFESSQDGRCSNCIRFNQECMFTPVSSQAQAFVPAHAAYPHLRNNPGGPPGGPPRPGVTLYGAHGQPLPAQHQPGAEALPPPPGMHGHYGGAPPLAPHMPDPRQPGGRRGSGSAFDYPDPPNLAPVTPTGITPGYQTHTAAPPHYPPPHDRRTSPQMPYAYEARHSSSPNGSPYPQLQPPQSGATPPPSSTPGSSRGGMGLRDMLNHDNPGRTNTDNDMLNALNRGRH